MNIVTYKYSVQILVTGTGWDVPVAYIATFKYHNFFFMILLKTHIDLSFLWRLLNFVIGT